MDPLLISLALAGLLVGATGTWSPCGFSMIETIGPTGHTGGRRTTIAACSTFAPFAVAGGLITFGALALAGSWLHGAGGTLAYLVAAALALAAAAAEARGVPIVPRVRRQLPVGWRRWMPMPAAAAGYGVLLGLGFTTFVLSYGVWALMAICLAIGEPAAGLVCGVAFGVGRALPIVVLAPLADRPAGMRACEAMAMRPSLLRGARLGDALALAVLAAVLAGTASAQGADRVERQAADPSVSGSALAFQRSNGQGILRLPAGDVRLPGGNPAVGGPFVAVTDNRGIAILDRRTRTERGRIGARRADAISLSRRFIAWRSRKDGKDLLRAAALSRAGKPGRSRMLAKARRPAQIGQPSLAGGKLVFARAGKRANRIVRVTLRGRAGGAAADAGEGAGEADSGEASAEAGEQAGEGAVEGMPGADAGEPPPVDGASARGEQEEGAGPRPAAAAAGEPVAQAARVRVSRRTLRSSRTEGLQNPAIRKGKLAYVQITRRRQRVRVAGLRGGKGKIVYKRKTGRGFIWSLALDRRHVYITLIKNGGGFNLIRARR